MRQNDIITLLAIGAFVLVGLPLVQGLRSVGRGVRSTADFFGDPENPINNAVDSGVSAALGRDTTLGGEIWELTHVCDSSGKCRRKTARELLDTLPIGVPGFGGGIFKL